MKRIRIKTLEGLTQEDLERLVGGYVSDSVYGWTGTRTGIGSQSP